MAIRDNITEAEASPFDIIDFEGGLYAMAVSIDDDHDSIMKVEDKIFRWIENTNFQLDESRDVMGSMAYNGEDIKKGLGYEQLQRFVPIKVRDDANINIK
jgi:hypothetical protein